MEGWRDERNDGVSSTRHSTLGLPSCSLVSSAECGWIRQVTTWGGHAYLSRSLLDRCLRLWLAGWLVARGWWLVAGG